MEINNKIIIIAIIAIFILLWYVNNAKKDISRYQNIIDTYMSENNKKSALKKVRFNLPEDNKEKK